MTAAYAIDRTTIHTELGGEGRSGVGTGKYLLDLFLRQLRVANTDRTTVGKVLPTAYRAGVVQ